MTSQRLSAIRIRWPIIILLLVQLLNGMVAASKGSFFSIYVTNELGYATAVATSLVSLGQVAGMVFAVLGGSLNDALGRKWTLVAGLGCVVVGGLAFLAKSAWIIGALWLVNGAAVSLVSLGGQGYLIAAAGGAGLGVVSALYNWGFTLGGALGSPIAGYVLDSGGYAGFVPLVVGLAAFTFGLAFLLMPQLSERQSQQKILWKETLVGYLSVVRQPTVIRLGLLRFLPTFYYGMSVVLIPLLIHAATGSNLAVAAYATANLILATLCQLVAGRAADRWGPRTPMLAALSGVICAALGLSIWAGKLWGLTLFGILGGAAAWSLSTLMPVLVSTAVPAQEHGRVIGALILLWNLAMMFGALVGGVLLEVYAGLPFAVAVIPNVWAIVIAVRFFKKEGAGGAVAGGAGGFS